MATREPLETTPRSLIIGKKWFHPLPEKTIEEIILALGAGLAVFLLLSMVYQVVYKRKVWRSRLFEIVLLKVRRWVYLTMILLSLKVASQMLSDGAVEHDGVDFFLTYSLVAMAGVLSIETASALVYNYLLREVRHAEVPPLYRDISRFLLYLVLAGVMATLLGFDVRALVTGGTVLTLVIGFATQESLGNVFAGVFLHSSRPFSRGDWVKLGEREGEIEKVEWRATTIRTRDGDYVIYPNAMLAKMEITNFSAPTHDHATLIPVSVHYRHSPAKVKRILIDCALKTEKVKHEPRPLARIRSFDDSAVRYELRYFIDEYRDVVNIQGAVLEKIWYHFKREDIDIPYPTRTVVVQREEKIDRESVNFKLLKRIDFLSEFPEHEIKYLASRLKVVTFTSGEPIIKQGEAGRSFYIVKEGRVEIQARNSEGTLFFTKPLGPGEFFGEISLLTGEPRTASVVALEESELLRLDKDAFRKIMEENPKADELISMVLARRQEYSAQKKAAKDAAAASASESDATSSTRALFVKKIRDFFAY